MEAMGPLGNLRLDPAYGKLDAVKRRLNLDEQKFQDVLSQTARKAAGEVTPERAAQEKKLMDASRQLESILVHQMIKSMRATLNEKDRLLDGGTTEKIFQDMLDSKYAETMSQRVDFGLAKQIFNQLKRSL